jgi:hypothetical protein
LVPVANAAIGVVARVGLEIVPAPCTNVQLPVPVAGVFPASVAELAQTDCDDPALDVVGKGSRTIATVEVEGGQTPLLMVHCKTFVPTAIAVSPEVADVGVVIVAAPEINVQLPVPTAGVFPASVAIAEHTC